MKIYAILLLALFLVACSGNTGTLTMQLTDAPTDLNIEKAMVTISGIQVHMTNGDETSGWQTVVQSPKTYDLIALKDVKELLGSEQVPAGKYTQIRLSVDSAKVTIDGEEHDLTVPSDKLKLVNQFEVVAGQETKLTLDFDAQESIVSTGSGKYNLKPTIKVINE